MSLVIPPKRCVQCGAWFTPSRNPRFCRSSCSRRWHGEQRRGQPPTAAIAALRKKAATEMRAKLSAQFGPLSVREIEIAKWIHGVAYQRGYNKAVAASQRKSAAIAQAV